MWEAWRSLPGQVPGMEGFGANSRFHMAGIGNISITSTPSPGKMVK